LKLPFQIRPPRDHASNRTATLYTRDGCHLCERARQVLEKAGVDVSEVDIAGDSELESRYGNTIPVVVIDGKERFRGIVDPVLLERLLKQR